MTSRGDAFVDFDALEAIVRTNAGANVVVTTTTSVWSMPGFAQLDPSGQPNNVPGGALEIRLDIPVIGNRFPDSVEYAYDSFDDEQNVTIKGVREFTLALTILSDSPLMAATVAERLRTRFTRAGVRAALLAIGCTVLSTGTVKSITVPAWDNREIDAVIFELFMNYNVVEVDDTDPAEGDYIASVTPLTNTEPDDGYG